MAVNSGLPKRISYSAFNTNTKLMVAGDQANHTLVLILDGVSLGAPTNPPSSVGNGVYEIALTEAERTGVDLLLTGSSSTADIILQQMQFSADSRWNELLELDGAALRGTAKYLELAPDSIADVSGLALEATVQQVLTTGGAGPWTYGIADTSGLALEATAQAIKGQTDKFTFNTSDVPIVDVQWWQEGNISGVQMIEDLAGQPRWTVRALSQAPAGGGGGSVTYVNMPTDEQDGCLSILRGDTLRFPLLLNTSLATVDEITYAIKRSTSDLDSEALLFISSTAGLAYINGEVAATPANGSIVVDSSLLGVILINCVAEEMAKLPEVAKSLTSEIQLRSGSTIYTVWTQKTSISGDIVRAAS